MTDARDHFHESTAGREIREALVRLVDDVDDSSDVGNTIEEYAGELEDIVTGAVQALLAGTSPTIHRTEVDRLADERRKELEAELAALAPAGSDVEGQNQ